MKNKHRMNNILDDIENQIAFNKGKNFFNKEAIRSMEFTPETIAAIECFWEIDTTAEKNLLIDYLTNRVLQEFCKVNQYYTFNAHSQRVLRDIYIDLFANIRNPNANHDLIAKVHYASIKKWLLKSNSFAEKIYTTKDVLVEPVACYEYSADLQLEIFQIDKDRIAGPVLDIGCGKQGNLVWHLRANGIEAYGFDRFAETGHFLTRYSWFEFEFGIEKWGTITSNLGFSNHFKHHHLRYDGHFIEYAKTFMDILNSLKIGGHFYYAPDLPFIEKYLESSKFKLEMQNSRIQKNKSIKITRLKK